MPVSATTHPTLVDLVKRQDPDGRIGAIAEILSETNSILDDTTWQEGNLPTGNRTNVRTGLPTPTWRKLYQGVQPTKSTTAQVTDNCGMLEAFAEVDCALAELSGNVNEFRLTEDRAHIEGMNIEMADTLFYGNEGTEPEAFTGLAPRFNDMSAGNGENIIDGGGTGSDNASIWLCVWGPQSGFGIVPKASIGGLQMENLGKILLQDADGSGGRMLAYVTHYRWDAGLTIRDWRYFVRIANIDRSALTPDAGSGADLADLMFQAIERLGPQGNAGRAVFYADRSVITKIRQQHSAGVANSTLTFQNLGGTMMTMFHEVPLRRVDALAGDEATVS